MPVEKEEYIACCGLDCAVCEARLATVRDDEALRVKVAKEWSALNRAEITPEMINCTGCRLPGPKTPFCESMCAIRPCAAGRGLKTCGECPEMRGCEKLSAITRGRPDALRRLEKA
jgi:hypothetical protein